MPRENSFSDEGASLTSEDEDYPAAVSPTYDGEPRSFARGAAPQAGAALPLRSPSKYTVKSSPSSRRTPLRPIQRFRAAARKVIAMHRGTNMIRGRGVGSEPGIDPRRATADVQYGGIHQDCVIELFDYSGWSLSAGRMTNKEFVDLMGDEQASERDAWVKVRWINISGISWDVIKAVSLAYDLHPLALEDVLHQRSGNRSKADYYSRHLFIRILCHELGNEDDPIDPTATPAYGSTLRRCESPVQVDDVRESYEMVRKSASEDSEEKTVYGSAPQTLTRRRRAWRRGAVVADDIESKPKVPMSRPLLRPVASTREVLEDMDRKRRNEEDVTVEALKRDGRVPVRVSPFYIFLLRDGTVISISASPSGQALTAPIAARLRERDTLLRKSADPSLLVQSLLDLLVDKGLEVIDAFHDRITQFEREVLLKPKMRTVRNLHIISGDLILHKRTLEPIKTVIYGLRRYDLDRCLAIVDPEELETKKVTGFMSHKSKIYLADVYDHMDYILSSLDMFANITENLIDYTFNMTSYEMNEIMRRLTLATIIFLPMTLLTGYFGMNFTEFWSVNNNSDVFFWELAIPIIVAVTAVFMWGDFVRIFHYLQKRWIARNAVKAYRAI
ncbi:hypothetical protein EV715DRAFT_289749 [Schizophyllum commune]